MTPSGQREGEREKIEWPGGKPIGFEMKSEIVVTREGMQKSARSLDEWIIESTTQTPHRSLTHVAIARTNDIEHNRRLCPYVFLLLPHSFIGMQASLALKVIRRTGFGKSCTASCATINFWCPLLARIPPFKQTKFPFGDVNDWIDSEGRYFFHLSRENEDGPAMIYQDDPPFCSEGFSHWRGSPRKGLKRMRWIFSGINLGRWSRWWKRCWEVYTIRLCLWSLYFKIYRVPFKREKGHTEASLIRPIHKTFE